MPVRVAEFDVPKGIRDEPRIGNVLGIGRQAVLESEAEHGDLEFARLLVAEELGHRVLQLMDVEVRGVEDHVGRISKYR